MNIDRQLGAIALRIEQSTGAAARSGTESAGTEGAVPSFASLLTALDPPVAGGLDSQTRCPQECVGLADAQVDAVEQEALVDVVALWAQGPVPSHWSPVQNDLAMPGQIDPSTLALAGSHAGPVLIGLPGRSEALPAGSELRPCGDAALGNGPAAEVTQPGGAAGGVRNVDRQMFEVTQPGGPAGRVRNVDRQMFEATQPDGAAEGWLDVESQVANVVVHGAITRSARYDNEPERHLSQRGSPQDSSAGSMRGAAATVAGESTRSEGRVALAAQLERLAPLAVAVAGDTGGGFRSLPGLRSTERQNGRSVFVPLDGVPASGNASSFATNAMAAAAPTGLPDAPFAAGASADVAQKVHYWITRGTQNAELQLDAFGGGAVDVSISVQGKEALVEFRSDQPEARRVLQDAMPQLREMLRSEGLALSGGFVGTSAQQDPQARRDGTDAAPARVGTVAMPGQPAEGPERLSTSRSHALDVFV